MRNWISLAVAVSGRFGTRKLSRFEENIAAIDLVLTDGDLDEIERVNIRIEGARYPDGMLKLVGI